ncbi:arylsulfotransferase family protein [Desulfatibacillum aliphaticivorans]|uniref:arylsulfotransferase family protein n=1 Tax=Desulfatibacillum aliphaticivorans TaxID=218208 RepID=UPI000404B961|nr:arylsulfotransferase family protein [Desulfatibacillum aliphaticivorans]
MRRFDASKFLFFTASIIIILGFTFILGLYLGGHKSPLYMAVLDVKHQVEDSFATLFGELPTLTKTSPHQFLQPAKYEGEGVTINHPDNDNNEFIFMTGFFDGGNEIRLITRDGAFVNRWPIRFSEIYEDDSHMLQPPATDWNVDIHGAVALPDGSVVFNMVHAGLVKLDRNGNVVWKLYKDTHHSVEIAEDGGFWVCSTRHYDADSASPLPPFETPCREDTALRVSDDGKLLQEISIPKLFLDNGLETILTANGCSFDLDAWLDDEIVHLNKVAELSRDSAKNFPMFEPHDLAISIRGYNLLAVFSPSTEKIKWWKIGPWRRQHDPEFSPDGSIVVFNNNIYRDVFGRPPHASESRPDIPRVTNIMACNPVTDQCKVLYGGVKGQEFLSVIRGKVELTARDGLLITEYEGGRVFETDAEGRIVWEYINRYDEDRVTEITGARIYPASYFSETDWGSQENSWGRLSKTQ